MVNARIDIPTEAIAAFCEKWKVVEFSLFGSVLRGDFRPDSDVDVLVVFKPESSRTIEDWEAMETELQRIFRRKVDLVEKRWIENPFRRHHILSNRQVIYAA